ncbi:MAG TPA: ATP-binding protein [Methanomassiliicoccales archaeon]|nr:ATP-binding protein [Methanomassiliicoccales archaeon]HPR98611.1 ATP-binding protein [Methanomassiliicoccales archaeon]
MSLEEGGRLGDRVGRTMICTLDLNGRLKYYNRTVEALLATDESRLLGTALVSLLQNGTAPLMDAALQQCLQGRSNRERLTMELGQARFLVSVTPVKEREEIVGVSLIGFLTDDDKRELTLDLVLDILQDHDLMVMVYSRDGYIVSTNSPFQRFLEVDRDILDGNELTFVLHGDEEEAKKVAKALVQPDLPSFATLTMKVQGRAVKLTWSLHPFLRDGKDLVLAVADPPILRGRLGPGNEALMFLAESSTDLISEGNPKDTLQSELDNLLRREGLDFAVMRLLGWDGRPQLFCSGIDFKQARELFETQVGDSSLAVKMAKGESCTCSALNTDCCQATSDLGFQSLVCLPLRFRGDFVGAGLFGKKAPIEDLETRKLTLQVFSNQMAMIYFYSLLNQHYQRVGSEFQTLFEISRLVSGTLDYREVLDIILSKSRELVESDNCIIYGFDRGGTRLIPLTYLSKYEVDPEALAIDVGEGITGDVARTGKGELVERADLDERAKQVDGTPEEPSSLICVPLKIGDEMLGVMTLEKVPGKPFTQDEYRLMELYSLHAAMALKNSGRFQDIKSKVSAQKIYNILLTHDVANYNVPIHGFLEMLIKDPKLDERQRRYVKSALAQSQNISNLITDVRKLWNILESDASVELVPVDLVPLLHDIVREIKTSYLFSDIPLELQYPEGEALVMANPLVRDVFFNVINNSAKYGDMKKVEVVMRPDHIGDVGYWRVEVRDQGKGIPEERKPQLFQRFENLDTGMAAESHGLGLSVVKALVDRYQGKVWVEDRIKGDHTKGSIFVIMLPKAR